MSRHEHPSTMVHASAFGDDARLGLLTKRAYTLCRGELSGGEPAALVQEAIYEPRGELDTLLLRDSDLLGLHKDTTDVVLDGSAHSQRGAVTELATALVVGSLRRDVIVTGDRALRVHADGSLAASPPAPFERMRLGWERAYGGHDAASERNAAANTRHATLSDIFAHGTHTYPRNRHGVGFFIDRDRRRLDGERLPNLSDPHDAVTLARLLAADPCDWVDRPTPAGYGPVGPLTFPRCWFFGIGLEVSQQRRPLHEVALGALLEHESHRLDDPSEPQPRAFNCAAPGLATRRLLGNERVELHNLHRDAERYTFALPGERPRLVIEPPNAGTFELEAKLATVLIEPDRDRVTLTWAGSTPTAGIYTPEACAAMPHGVLWP